MTHSRTIFRLRLLQGMILLGALPFGAALEPYNTLFYIVMVVWTAFAWPDARERIGIPGGKWLERLALTIPLLALLQLIPMPRGIVESLHPGALPLLESLPRQVGEWLPLSLAPGITVNTLIQLLALVLFFLTLARLPVSRREVRGIITALLASGSLQVLIGIARILLPGKEFFLFFHRINNPLPGIHLTGTFADNDAAAIFLGTVIMAFFGFWAAEAGLFSSRKGKPETLREWLMPGKTSFTHVLLLALCCLGFILTHSRNMRWMFTSVGLAMLIMVLYTQFSPETRRPWRWILLATILLIVVMTGWRYTNPTFVHGETGSMIAINPTPALNNMIKDFPILGTGWGTFSAVNPIYLKRPELHFSHARNEWLEVAVEGGLLSLGFVFFFLSMYLYGAWRAWLACNDRWLRAVFSGFFLAALLIWGGAAFYNPLRIPFFAFLGILLMTFAIGIPSGQEPKKQ